MCSYQRVRSCRRLVLRAGPAALLLPGLLLLWLLLLLHLQLVILCIWHAPLQGPQRTGQHKHLRMAAGARLAHVHDGQRAG